MNHIDILGPTPRREDENAYQPAPEQLPEPDSTES